MKIVQVNVVYKSGSTGKIVHDCHNEYKKLGHESIVVYGRGNRVSERGVYKNSTNFLAQLNKLISFFTGYEFGGAFLSTLYLIRLLKKEKPDIVHLHCINGYTFNICKIINFLKTNNYKTVITNHAEFFYTGSYSYVPDGSYQWLSGTKENHPDSKKLSHSLFFDRAYDSINKFHEAFRNFKHLVVVSVSPWVTERSSRSFVLKKHKHLTVLNGINTEIFQYRVNNEIFNKYKKNGSKIILYITSGFKNPLKGRDHFLKVANLMSNQNITFLIVGNNDYKIDLPKNCINLGIINDQIMLAEFYSLADLVLLTSKKETFSMIVAESLSCGTPVVGFKSGGPETIALSEFSVFVDYGDTNALVSAILNILEKNIKFNLVDNPYKSTKMAHSYLNIYKDLIEM